MKQGKTPAKAPTPKGLLHEVYTKQGVKDGLTFEVHAGAPPPAPPTFLCNLTIQGMHSRLGSFGPQEFNGMGPSKRASEHVASQKALLFLQSRHLLPPGPDIIPKIPDPAAASAARPATPAPGAEPSIVEEPEITPQEGRTYVLTQLDGKEIQELGAIELKSALETALQKNTELKASLHHDQQRCHRAMAILLGIN